MADGLLGALSGDDKTLGLIAAGIGLLSGNQGRNRRDAFGNALGGGLNAGAGILNPIMQMQQIQGMKQDRESQRKLQERSVAVQEFLAKDNNEMKKLQIEQLRSQQAARQALLGMPQSQPGAMAPGPDGTQIGIPGQAPTVPGVQFGGQPAPQGMPQGMPQPQSGGGLTLQRIQQAFAAGLPLGDVIKLYELQNPEKKVENGVAYDSRQLAHGQVVPGMMMGQGGEAMVRIPDPQSPGGFRVAPAPGALDAFAQYQQIRGRAGAEFNAPVRVTNPDGTETLMTPPQFRDTATGSAPSLRVSPQQQGQRDQARVSVLQAERAAAIARGDSAAVTDLDRELGSTRLPGVQSGMSSQQRAAAEANSAQQVKAAQERAGRQEAVFAKAYQAPFVAQRMETIGNLLGDFEGGKFSKAGFELARAFNSAGIKIDSKLANKEAAEALGNQLSLELRNTSEGAGMPGAMSDRDRDFLKGMTPQMSQSAAGRKTLIDAHRAMAQRQQALGSMAQRYLEKYGSLDEQFFAQATQFNMQNPIFGAVRIPGQ